MMTILVQRWWVIVGMLLAALTVRAEAPGGGLDWWQWRGPKRDNTSPETGLALDWTKTPPTELWRVNVGRSIASLVVAGGHVYASGVELKKGEDSIWALDAETGRVIWRYAFPCDVPAEYGSESPVWYPEWSGTHATPTVCEGRLYAVSQDGRALCLDAATGKLLWSRTGLGRGPWGYNTSPLVIGNMVILESGLTLDTTTGETLWTGLGGGAGGRVASSPVRFARNGQDCVIVESASREFQAFTLADRKPFWKVHSGEAWEPDSDPLVMGDRVLFANGDRPATLAAIGEAQAHAKWSAIHNGYDTPILYQGYLYSTSGYGARDFQCYDAKDGSLKWKTSYQDRHNYNPTFMILADGKLILQHLQGLVEVVKPSPESCQSLGTYDLNGKKPEHFADSAWQTPALSRGRLYCRMNFGDVVALDIRVDRPAPPAPPPIPDGYVQKLPRADQNMAGPVASEDRQGGLGEEIRVARVESNEKNALVPPFQKPGPSDYFQGRGPNRDGIVQGSKLPLDWRQGQPRELWRVDIGMGYSSPVVAGDRLYIMGWYDDATWSGAARGSFNRCCHNFIGCLDVRTGRTIWKCAYLPAAFGWVMDVDREGHYALTCMGPRGTPALAGDRLYALDQAGEAFCLDAASGKVVWRKDLMRDPGLDARPAWFFSGSPLVLDNVVVFAAGTAGIALDKASGKVVWSTGPEACGSASPLLFEQAGAKRLAIFGQRDLYSLDPETGKVLWQYPWNDGVGENRCDPVAVGDDRLLVCGGHGRGCALLAVGSDRPLWQSPELNPQMAAPILYQDHLYGPSQTRGELMCLDATSGQVKWRQKMDATQVTLVGQALVIQCRAGDIQLAEATPAGYKPLGSAHVLDGNECWTPAVVAGGRLFCRGWDGELAALDLKALVPPAPVEVVKASAELMGKLGARLLAERESAVAKLSAVQGEEAAKFVPLLAEKVRQGTYFEQTSAARVLLKLRLEAKPAVAELLAGAKAAVERRDWALAEPLIQALLGIDPASVRPVCPAVAAALKDDKSAVRRQALASVTRINPPADRSLVEALAGMLADEDGLQAFSAALALANMGQTPGETLPVLMRTIKLRHSRPYAALHALAALGPAARPAMSDLVRLSANAEPQLQKAIQAALRKIRATDVPPLVQDANCTCTEGGFCQIKLAVTDEDDVPQAVPCIVVTKPSHGTAVLRGTTIEYTADRGYVGKDVLTWKARDENGQSAVATVHIDVRADTTRPTVKSVTTTADPQAGAPAEDWPCWRGAAGDNNSAWIPKGLPPQTTPRWKSPLTGAAHSGVVVSGRCVVVMDTLKDQQDTVRCLSTDTGKELWKHAYPNRGKSIPWGSCPRATPAISGGIVYTLSARGQLFALDLQNGHVLWQKDLTKDFRADLPTWAYCSSPLVVGNRLIVNPGSPRYSLVALDLKTGKTVWNASGAEANYGSYLVAEVQGFQQIVGYDQEEVSGRSTVDGRVIWSKPLGKTPGYLVPSPVVMRDQLLLCGSNGAQLQDLKEARGKLPAAWEVRNRHFKIGDATPTPAEGMALAVVDGKGLTAMEINKDLKILWQTGDEGMDCHFASVMAGSGRALVLDFAGTLHLFDVNRTGAKSLGKLKVCAETYAAPALTCGRLYVRDEESVYRYDTGVKSGRD